MFSSTPWALAWPRRRHARDLFRLRDVLECSGKGKKEERTSPNLVEPLSSALYISNSPQYVPLNDFLYALSLLFLIFSSLAFAQNDQGDRYRFGYYLLVSFFTSYFSTSLLTCAQLRRCLAE